ncbi:Ubiquitin-conjugating enzyme E2 D2 [Paramecium bursaria]
MLQEIIDNLFTTDRLKRINEEKYIIQQENQEIYHIYFEDDLYWIVRIRGPDGSPFEGFWYKIRIDFPQDYPNYPPQVRFITPMYHPFISDQGDVYLDQYLTNNNWFLYITIRKILKTIRQYLGVRQYDFEIRIKSKKVIAEEYKNTYNVYVQQARQFALKHGDQQ